MLKQNKKYDKNYDNKGKTNLQFFFILKPNNTNRILDLKTKLLSYKHLSLILSLERNRILLKGSFKSSDDLMRFIKNIYSSEIELSYYLIMQGLHNKSTSCEGGENG